MSYHAIGNSNSDSDTCSFHDISNILFQVPLISSLYEELAVNLISDLAREVKKMRRFVLTTFSTWGRVFRVRCSTRCEQTLTSLSGGSRRDSPRADLLMQVREGRFSEVGMLEKLLECDLRFTSDDRGLLCH
jgi:hypothetical protein